MRIPKKVDGTQIVWEGPFPNKVVIEQRFEFPDGEFRDFYLWGKSSQKPVVVLAVTRDGRVILTEQWRPGSDGIVEEFPGGHLKAGQTPEEALADELREEIGYKAGSIIKLPEFWLDPPSNQVIVAGYLALNCEKVGEPKPEKSEVIQKVELSIREWIERSQSDGENRKDSKTLSIMWLALPYLARAGFIAYSVL